MNRRTRSKVEAERAMPENATQRMVTSYAKMDLLHLTGCVDVQECLLERE
jgi:hypothetical protein